MNSYHNKQLTKIQSALIQTLTLVCKGNIENQICLFEFLPIAFEPLIKFPQICELITLIL